GFGFRCGFLGLLHMEIIQERLEREYELELITTAPGVRYHITLTDGSEIEVDNPSRWPEPQSIASIREPVITAKILTNEEYVGGILKLVEEKRGKQVNFEYVTQTRLLLTMSCRSTRSFWTSTTGSSPSRAATRRSTINWPARGSRPWSSSTFWSRASRSMRFPSSCTVTTPTSAGAPWSLRCAS